MVHTQLLLWSGVLLVAVFAAHWGAEQLAEPLKKLRRQWGLTAVAGAAFVGLSAASPEIGINIVSASSGVSEIGLGVMLGSNIVAIPFVITTAYFASRTQGLSATGAARSDRPISTEDTTKRSNATAGESGGSSAHEQHLLGNLLRVKREAVTVLALPYLGILGLVAVLTMPAGWRGLQPADGWIMGGAYVVFLSQAVFRGREDSTDVTWKRRELGMAAAGLLVLALGAFGTVRATENMVAAVGISKLIGGLFITAPMAVTPELFATWSVIRSGQVTAGTASVLGDHAVTMSVAFVPLALVTVPIENFQLFWVNLTFVMIMPLAYAGLLHWGSPAHGFELWQVVALDGIYVVYIGLIVFWILNIP